MLNSTNMNDFIVNIDCFVQMFCSRKATLKIKFNILKVLLMEKATHCLNNCFMLARQSFEFSTETQEYFNENYSPKG